MTFLWPELLWLLVALPGLIATYFFVLREKRKAALRYASLSMMKATSGAASTVKRQIPPILFLFALVAMVIALARPIAVVTAPHQYQTIVLAIDSSGSMAAKDVDPDRFGSARGAARAFVADQAMQTRIGVVAFAATASLVQPPTDNRDNILAAIDRLQQQPGTAVGSAILASLKAIFPDEQFEIESSNAPRGASRESKRNAKGEVERSRQQSKEPDDPVSPGSYRSAAVILFTDGQATTGPDPIEAARIAGEHGVRVYTVGIGTTKGETISVEGWSMRVRVDEEALKTIAALTHGEYFYGGTARDLKQVYQRLNTRLFWEKQESEITFLFTALGAVLLFLGASLSLWWFNRVL